MVLTPERPNFKSASRKFIYNQVA